MSLTLTPAGNAIKLNQCYRARMDHPFLVGFLVLGAVWLIGSMIERFHKWARPAAVLATVALIVEVLWLAFL